MLVDPCQAVAGQFVSWCFKPSQPQRIASGLRETFIKRYLVERTNKAEIKPEEQSGKTERCLENSWDEIELKGPLRQKQTQQQNKKKKRSGQARLVYVFDMYFIPTT